MKTNEPFDAKEQDVSQEQPFEEDANRRAFDKFMDVQHVMHALHHRKMAQGGPGCDPLRGRGRILALLKLKDGVATKDMAQILGIRVSSLNETLAKLEKDGLVERTPSDQDKRIMLVSLTDAGRAQAQPAGRFPERMFANFSEEDLAAFEGYLDRITANFEAELGEEAHEYLQNMRRARREFAGHGHGHGRGCCRGRGHEHGPDEEHSQEGHHGPGRGRCEGGHFPGDGHHGPGRGRCEGSRFPGEGHAHGRCCHGHGHGYGPEGGRFPGEGHAHGRCCHDHGFEHGHDFGHGHHRGHGCRHRH